MIDHRTIRIQYFKSSGPGGQHKNKRFSAVKVIHLPTGITAVATEQRSQFQNKAVALERLAQKLERFNRKKKKRIPTKIPSVVRERILQVKKRRSEKKQSRQKISEDE